MVKMARRPRVGAKNSLPNRRFLPLFHDGFGFLRLSLLFLCLTNHNAGFSVARLSGVILIYYRIGNLTQLGLNQLP
jgi:hypothetical protein